MWCSHLIQLGAMDSVLRPSPQLQWLSKFSWNFPKTFLHCFVKIISPKIVYNHFILNDAKYAESKRYDWCWIGKFWNRFNLAVVIYWWINDIHLKRPGLDTSPVKLSCVILELKILVYFTSGLLINILVQYSCQKFVP